MKFISIDGKSIKLSNIKNFGVSSTRREKVYVNLMEKKAISSTKKESLKRGATSVLLSALSSALNSRPNIVFAEKNYELVKLKEYTYLPATEYRVGMYYLKDNNGKIVRRYNLDENTTLDPNISMSRSEVEITKYLYITTYQNDNYKFFDYKIDVDKEHENLLKLINQK